MKVLSVVEAAQELARLSGKPVLYLAQLRPESYDLAFQNGTLALLSAPFLNLLKHGQEISDGEAVILCESTEELWSLFYRTHGDDGYGERNKGERLFAGDPEPCLDHRVYALTINALGEMENENT